MKHILSLLLIVGFFGNLYAQYPNTSNKMRLGAQTTGDGLIFRTDSIPDWTPSSLNNAWLAIDTLTGNVYSYQGAEWRLEVAGDLRTVYPRVINKSGTDIKRGQPVMVDYNQIIQGDLIRILPADGSGTYAGILTMGIASTDIADDAEGFITWFGYVREVKQSDIIETGDSVVIGDILYLSGTQLGKLTTTEPTAPKLRVTMALVVRKPNANNMTLLVRPNLNSDLGELNDVDLTGLNDGETIVYDSLNGKWIPGTATGGGGTTTFTIETNQQLTLVVVDDNNATPWDGLSVIGVFFSAPANEATFTVNGVVQTLAFPVDSTNLSFSGPNNNITLESSTGTDVRFVGGTGITITRGLDSVLIRRMNLTYIYLVSTGDDTLSYPAATTNADTLTGLFISAVGSNITNLGGGNFRYSATPSRIMEIVAQASFTFTEANNVIKFEAWRTNSGTTVSLGPFGLVEAVAVGQVMHVTFTGIFQANQNDEYRFGFSPSAHTGDDDIVVKNVTITISEI
jgi:hypothetical protein